MTTTADSAQRVADALAAVQNGPGGEAQVPAVPVPVDPDTLATMSLAERLARITAEVGPVAKSGRNAHFNYSYQRAEDVAAAVAPLLGRYGVAITPQIDHHEVKGEDSGRTTSGGATIRDWWVPIDFVIACETGEKVVPWLALANDDSDKGVNKAITAGLKSFLRAQFLIPTGDDDTDSTTGSKAAAEGSRPSWDGVMPDVKGATINGGIATNPSGGMALSFEITPRSLQTEINTIVKALGGRWNQAAKGWEIPPANIANAVTLARHLGIGIPETLAAEHPASPPAAAGEESQAADDLAPKADPPFAGAPNADDVPPGEPGQPVSQSDDYDVPF